MSEGPRSETRRTTDEIAPARERVERRLAPNARSADTRPLFDQNTEGRNIPAPLWLRLLAFISLGLSCGTSIGVLLAGVGFWFFNCVAATCSGSITLTVAVLAGVYGLSGLCMTVISLVSCRAIMRPRRRGEYWPTASLAVVYALQGGALTPLLDGIDGSAPILLAFLLLALLCAVIAVFIRRERPVRPSIAGRRDDS